MMMLHFISYRDLTFQSPNHVFNACVNGVLLSSRSRRSSPPPSIFRLRLSHPLCATPSRGTAYVVFRGFASGTGQASGAEESHPYGQGPRSSGQVFGLVPVEGRHRVGGLRHPQRTEPRAPPRPGRRFRRDVGRHQAEAGEGSQAGACAFILPGQLHARRSGPRALGAWPGPASASAEASPPPLLQQPALPRSTASHEQGCHTPCG